MAADLFALIPDSLKIESVDGKQLVTLRAAARLAGLHPAIVQMGEKLISGGVGSQGAAFTLGTKELQAKAIEIEALFVKGLRKVAKHFNQNVKVRSTHDRAANRLVFWYDVKGERVKRRAVA